MGDERPAVERNPKQGPTLPEGEGESARRREGIEKGGGHPLTEQLEDGQLRGTDEDGRHTTGTHGGPTKEGGGREPDRPKR